MVSPGDVHEDDVAAIRALSTTLPDISPIEHANLLQAQAPGFALCLANTEILAQFELYNVSGCRAGEAQKLFQRFTRGANGAICITAVLSAGLLVLPVLLPDTAPGWRLFYSAVRACSPEALEQCC
jgi:hypothetical protein